MGFFIAAHLVGPKLALLQAMKTQALHIQSLDKLYGASPVLTGVDLRVQAGEYFGLVGANGAGKTTLIKSLLDFCQIDGGDIRIFETSHTETRARSQLAYLPERFNPPYYLTGREFLLFMAQLHGVSYDRQQVESLLHHLDLDTAALSRPVRRYSKGMAQKLGLAACFLSQKPLLILDEPMSGLDPRARALFKQYLLARKDQQLTVFFTTHLLHDVETLCDRLAILDRGHVCFVGSPQQCRETYQTDDLEQAYLKAVDSSALNRPAA